MKRAADGILVVAKGYLCLSAVHKVDAVFSVKSNQESIPHLIEVLTMEEFFEVVGSRDVKAVRVELCDLRFRCKVIGCKKETCQLQLLGASFFRGVARGLTARSILLPAKARPHGGRSKS